MGATDCVLAGGTCDVVERKRNTSTTPAPIAASATNKQQTVRLWGMLPALLLLSLAQEPLLALRDVILNSPNVVLPHSSRPKTRFHGFM